MVLIISFLWLSNNPTLRYLWQLVTSPISQVTDTDRCTIASDTSKECSDPAETHPIKFWFMILGPSGFNGAMWVAVDWSH